MLSNYIETFALSLIQGVFEFLPISSSAHLLVVAEIFNFNSSSLIIDISLHLGSLLAITVYFRKDLLYDSSIPKFKTLNEAGRHPMMARHLINDIENSLNL